MKKIIEKIVYYTTDKPKYYKVVKNPPKNAIEKLIRRQDARQVQYNKWSRVHKVYSGSYLPENPEDLFKKNWTLQKVGNQNHRVIQRNTTKQTVRYDYHKGDKPHAHWLDLWDKNISSNSYNKFRDKEFSGKDVYYNKYGEVVSKRDPSHHIYFEEDEKNE